jgi:3-hydroxybutyryl-CoA dehydratase
MASSEASHPDTVHLEDIEVGMRRSRSKPITDRDIELFGEVSTDRNPVHFDDDFAKATIFKGRIAHGMMSAALISAVLGEELPGPGTIYLGQTLRFRAPVRPGETLTATVTVTAVDAEKGRVTLDTVCTVGDTEVVKGEATVMAPRRTR